MILSCEHHTGMGLCSDCAREVDRSVQASSERERKRERLQRVIRDLEAENEHAAAQRMREKLAKV
jgi:type II secretory pathway component PulJ